MQGRKRAAWKYDSCRLLYESIGYQLFGSFLLVLKKPVGLLLGWLACFGSCGKNYSVSEWALRTYGQREDAQCLQDSLSVLC